MNLQFVNVIIIFTVVSLCYLQVECNKRKEGEILKYKEPKRRAPKFLFRTFFGTLSRRSKQKFLRRLFPADSSLSLFMKPKRFEGHLKPKVQKKTDWIINNRDKEMEMKPKHFKAHHKHRKPKVQKKTDLNLNTPDKEMKPKHFKANLTHRKPKVQKKTDLNINTRDKERKPKHFKAHLKHRKPKVQKKTDLNLNTREKDTQSAPRKSSKMRIYGAMSLSRPYTRRRNRQLIRRRRT